ERMQIRHHPRPAHRLHARRIEVLARLQHAYVSERDDRKILRQLAFALRGARLQMLLHRLDAIGRSDAGGDASVAELARERDGLGTVGRDIKWNRAVETNEPAIAMNVANLAAHPLGVVSRLAVVEQLADDADLLAKDRVLDRRQPHHAASGVTGAETQ